MLIRDLLACPEFIAGDRTLLRELLHPARQMVDIRYSLAHATVRPGVTSQRHRLKTAEVYYILQGKGLMEINERQEVVSAGQAVYIPPGAVQCIKNSGVTPLTFLCIVDPAWRAEDEEVL